MCNLSCYYAEDRRFDSCFGWHRATQHSPKVSVALPRCWWLQSSVNLQSQNWTESYSNVQSQNWNESCEEVQKKIINSIPNFFSKSDNIQIHQYIEMSQNLNASTFISGDFHVLVIRKPLSVQRQPRDCNSIPSFLQWTTPIARSFCCAYHPSCFIRDSPGFEGFVPWLL